MAEFKPFKAYRYQLQKVTLTEVIAPPYDVISLAGQDRLYQKSPYNCIRLILNREEAQDSEKQNRYTRARDFLAEWIRQGVLTQEQQPAFYVYQQDFKDIRSGEQKTRTSILGRLKLEPFDRGVVIPHEKTLAKPKADRRKLFEATDTNLSPVFGLYEDANGEARAQLEAIMSRLCDAEASDEDGVRHRLWVVQEAAATGAFSRFMEKRPVYIADGHHRYQTALDYAADLRAKEGVAAASEQPYDSVLMALVAFEDAGISLYPTHRLVTLEKGDAAARLEKLKQYFDVEPAAAENLVQQIETSPASQTKFGLLLDGKAWLLSLKDWKAASAKIPAGKPELWYKLDVSLVSHLILGDLWGVPESAWENVIRYTHSDPEALEWAHKNPAAAVFVLKAPLVSVLRDMGQARELMPQKSTYFYPKLASGLVMNPLSEDLPAALAKKTQPSAIPAAACSKNT